MQDPMLDNPEDFITGNSSLRDVNLDKPQWEPGFFGSSRELEPLAALNLTPVERKILERIESTYRDYQHCSDTPSSDLRESDIYASRTNLLNYIRGLKVAFDIVQTTDDAFGRGMYWQAHLY